MDRGHAVAEDWFVVEIYWPLMEIGTSYHLSGTARGHSLVPDGHRFISTPLLWLDTAIYFAATRNTIYRLGSDRPPAEVTAIDLQRVSDHLAGLWTPPSAVRLALEIPQSLFRR